MTLDTQDALRQLLAGIRNGALAGEGRVTCETLGSRASLVSGVGVVGIHRLLHRLDALRQARVILVAAGMEGALASVVGVLVSQPIVAVPTSVGYGAACAACKINNLFPA